MVGNKRNKDRIKQARAFGEKRKKNVHKLSLDSLISAPAGSSKDPKRIGRGQGSGMGKTSTRGQKGQRSRASSIPVGFEGGQLPIYKRMPKRGFKNRTSIVFQPVNLRDLQNSKLTGSITPQILEDKGLIKTADGKIKILGTGELQSALSITADAISASALEKLQKAGGSFISRVAEQTNAGKD